MIGPNHMIFILPALAGAAPPPGQAEPGFFAQWSQRLRDFFEEVAPILTQHRGINAKSRVLMNAVAQRLGLAEDELERALATLQQRAGDPDEDDPRQEASRLLLEQPDGWGVVLADLAAGRAEASAAEAAGGVVTLRFRVTIDAAFGTPITNTATVSWNVSDSANASVTVVVGGTPGFGAVRCRFRW